MHSTRSFNEYLIILDERAHTTQGGFEGREPIGGPFRNVKENLQSICNPLPLYWEPLSRQGTEPTEGYHSHQLGSGSFPESAEFAGRRFRNMASLLEPLVDVSVKLARRDPRGSGAQRQGAIRAAVLEAFGSRTRFARGASKGGRTSGPNLGPEH